MAGGRDIKAGGAFVELAAKDKNLETGLKRAQARVRAFGDAVSNAGIGMSVIGAGITAPMLAAARSFASIGDGLSKMSQRTNISVQALSELSYVATQNGTSAEAMEAAIKKLQMNIGSGASAFKTYGMSLERIQTMRAEQQFLAVADHIGKIQDPAKRAAAAVALMGESAVSLMPMMLSGAAGMEKLRKSARDLGITMTDEDAAAAVKLTDAYDTMGYSIRGISNQIGAAISGPLTNAATGFSNLAKGAISYIQSNREIVATVFRTGTAIAVFGAALTAIGIGIKSMQYPIDGLRIGLSALQGTIGLFASAASMPFTALAAGARLAWAAITSMRTAFAAAHASFASMMAASYTLTAALKIKAAAIAVASIGIKGLRAAYMASRAVIVAIRSAMMLFTSALATKTIALKLASAAVALFTGSLALMKALIVGSIIAVKLVAAALASPFVLLAAAVAGVGYMIYSAFQKSGGIMKSLGGVVDWIKEKFWSIIAYMKPIYEAIKKAFDAGDYGGAARLAWTAIKVEFSRGWIYVRGLMADATDWLGGVWDAAIHAITTAWWNLPDSVRSVTETIVQNVLEACKAIASLFSSVASMGADAMGWISLAGNEVLNAVGLISDEQLKYVKTSIDNLKDSFKSSVIGKLEITANAYLQSGIDASKIRQAADPEVMKSVADAKLAVANDEREKERAALNDELNKLLEEEIAARDEAIRSYKVPVIDEETKKSAEDSIDSASPGMKRQDEAGTFSGRVAQLMDNSGLTNLIDLAKYQATLMQQQLAVQKSIRDNAAGGISA